MDFLLLLPLHRRAVIELDGIQHFADSDDRADPARYAEMASADRELRLAGYEVYRFGGHEIADKDKAAVLLDVFFNRLLGDMPHADQIDPATRDRHPRTGTRRAGPRHVLCLRPAAHPLGGMALPGRCRSPAARLGGR